ncbi:MAG: type sorting protein [Bacteroidetes bacterium]|jgi:hypothetical protein|nr:type sorting protein [Bacteroidota bacterium]
MKTLLIILMMGISHLLFPQSTTGYTDNKPTEGTSVREESLRGKIKIYPNPVKDNLTIHLKENDTPVSVILYNSSRQVVYSDTGVYGLSELSISTTSLEKGVYILIIKDHDDEVGNRIVIN